MGQPSKPDHAYIDFGRPGGRKLSSHHVGYRLNIEVFEGLNSGESFVVIDAAEMMAEVKWSINQRLRVHACMPVITLVRLCLVQKYQNRFSS